MIMRLDGLTLFILAKEINMRCAGLRVERIFSCGRYAVDLGLQRGVNLHLDCSPEAARVTCAGGSKGARQDATSFVMVLRKHLEGGRMLSASKAPGENLISIFFQGWDDDDADRPKRLILEATGPLSNIFFLDSQSTIIDSFRKAADQRKAGRADMPGETYMPLLSIGLPDALEVTRDVFVASTEKYMARRPDVSYSKAIYGGLYGLSKEHASDLIAQSKGSHQSLVEAAVGAFDVLRDLLKRSLLGEWSCSIVGQDGTNSARYSLVLPSIDGIIGPSECIERVLGTGETVRALETGRATLSKSVGLALKRATGKLEARMAELASSEDADKYRVWADAILSSMHELSSPLPAIATLPDYSKEQPAFVEVALEPGKTAPANAERYYKRYNKSRRTIKALSDLILEAQGEVGYLSSIVDSIDRTEDKDVLEQIREEAAMSGFGPKGRNKPSKVRVKSAGPLQYTLSSGHKALVGRNNTQNDEITFKTARPWDIWLHVKNAPGSHVIIGHDQGDKVPDAAILEAAGLALQHSSLKNQQKGEIDYTEVRKVKKIKGGMPGSVTYTGQKTLIASK
jgi:predicted ribosome quality control (RQC) complex YloA/Tae2 family protein